jgi:hypothetical protein
MLEHMIVPSVRLLYPDGVIQFQQNHSSIHNFHVVKEWLSWQADVKVTDWLSQAPDMHPIENMWSQMKKTTQETWRDLPPRNRDAVWTPVSDTWDEAALSQLCVLCLLQIPYFAH